MLTRKIITFFLIALLPVGQASLYINLTLSNQQTTSFVSTKEINTAIYGGKFDERLKEGLENAFIDSVAGEGAEYLGDQKKAKKLENLFIKPGLEVLFMVLNKIF